MPRKRSILDPLGLTPAREPLADPYLLVSVQAVPAPTGATGLRWHRYEIAQGGNRIVGYRQGGLRSVSTDAKALVIRLNERRLLHQGRTHLALSSKSKTKQLAVSPET